MRNIFSSFFFSRETTTKTCSLRFFIARCLAQLQAAAAPTQKKNLITVDYIFKMPFPEVARRIDIHQTIKKKKGKKY